VCFIADQNVPESVVQFFLDRGDEVTRARDLKLAEAPEEVYAALGDKSESIILTWDEDFKILAGKMPHGTRARFTKLGRILFQCRERDGRARLESLIGLIALAYEQAQLREDKRLLIIVGSSYVRFEL
jgi:hypothetical protein